MMFKKGLSILLVVASTKLLVGASDYDESYLNYYKEDYNKPTISSDDLKDAKQSLQSIKKERERQEELKRKQEELAKLKQSESIVISNSVDSFTNSSKGTLTLIESNLFTPQQFINLISSKVIEISSKYNIWPSLCIANAIQESAYGNSYIAKNGNNIFGIKAYSDWKGSTVGYAPASEDNGKAIPYRAYSSLEDSIYDFCELMQLDRYAPIRNASDVFSALQFHKTGYAGDSTKDAQLLNIINTYDLTQYDKPNNNIELSKVDNVTPKESSKAPLEEYEYKESLTDKIFRLFGI